MLSAQSVQCWALFPASLPELHVSSRKGTSPNTSHPAGLLSGGECAPCCRRPSLCCHTTPLGHTCPNPAQGEAGMPGLGFFFLSEPKDGCRSSKHWSSLWHHSRFRPYRGAGDQGHCHPPCRGDDFGRQRLLQWEINGYAGAKKLRLSSKSLWEPVPGHRPSFQGYMGAPQPMRSPQSMKPPPELSLTGQVRRGPDASTQERCLLPARWMWLLPGAAPAALLLQHRDTSSQEPPCQWSPQQGYSLREGHSAGGDSSLRWPERDRAEA